MPDLITPFPVLALLYIKYANKMQGPLIYFSLDKTFDSFSILEV